MFSDDSSKMDILKEVKSYYILKLLSLKFDLDNVQKVCLWPGDERWKPSDDLPNQEKNQYWTVYP